MDKGASIANGLFFVAYIGFGVVGIVDYAQWLLAGKPDPNWGITALAMCVASVFMRVCENLHRH
jgi:hypothetical protein